MGQRETLLLTAQQTSRGITREVSSAPRSLWATLEDWEWIGRQLRIPGLRGQYLLWHKVKQASPSGLEGELLSHTTFPGIRPVRHCSLENTARCAGAVVGLKPHWIIITCYWWAMVYLTFLVIFK